MVRHAAGDQGLTGDFNGDGKTDILVYRPATAHWFVRLSNGSSFSDSGGWHVGWGNTSGDNPLVGDFNGDGYSDIGIFRTSGTYPNWFVKQARWDGGFGSTWSTSWGNHDIHTEKPLIGNFNGDYNDDIAIFRFWEN